MLASVPAPTANQAFYYAAASPLGRQRLLGWGLFVCLTVTHGIQLSPPSLSWPGPLVALCIILVWDWRNRRQRRPGQALVTLNEDFLDAPLLSATPPRLAWRDIEQVSLHPDQERLSLRFQLRPDSQITVHPNFWTGHAPHTANLPLNGLSAADSEHLLRAIDQRLADSASPLQQQLAEQQAHPDSETALQAQKPHPWGVYTLLLLMVAVWLGGLWHGASRAGTPITLLYAWGGNAASAVQGGEWWRLLSATFLHSGHIHLSVNLATLYLLGAAVERLYGTRLFLLLYFGSALAGSAASLHCSAQHSVSIGASGALFGLGAALLLTLLRQRKPLRPHLLNLGLFATFALIYGFTQTGIDNAAHLGGAVAGGLVAWLLPSRLDPLTFARQRLRRSLLCLLILGLGTLAIVQTAPKARLDMARVISNDALLKRAIAHFQEASRNLQIEHQRVLAGTLSAQEADQRNRTYHAPLFQHIATEFSQVALPPDDPRQQPVHDYQRLTELFAEMLDMKTRLNPASGQMESTTPQRMQQIQIELSLIGQRIKQHADAPPKRQVRAWQGGQHPQ